MVLIAQLTDTHVRGPGREIRYGVDHNLRLEQAVATINGERPQPDAVLATGDLTFDGKADELDELLRLLGPLEAPVLALPGNHDEQVRFRDAFDMPWSADDHLSWIVEVGELQIIGLDITVPGAVHGDFDETRERWLRDALDATAGRPSMLALHHPPFDSGIALMDRTRLRRADAFIEAVTAAPHVTRVVCGHLHRSAMATFTGVNGSTTVTTCLSTVHQPVLSLDPDEPFQLIDGPAGYQLHRFDGSTWVSHTRYIGIDELPFEPGPYT